MLADTAGAANWHDQTVSSSSLWRQGRTTKLPKLQSATKAYAKCSTTTKTTVSVPAQRLLHP